MKSGWRNLLWPLALLHYWRITFSRKMFERGTWKSVRFNVPVVALHSMTNFSIPQEVMLEIGNACLLEFDSYSILLPRYSKKEINGNKEFHSIVPIGPDDSTVFGYKHLILGISELVAYRGENQAILLQDHNWVSEVRAALNVLVVDLNRPFYQEWLAPVGDRLYRSSSLALVDVVVVHNCSKFYQIAELFAGLNGYLKEDAQVMLIDHLLGKAQKIPDISGDELLIIQDRSNFGRILSDSLAQRISNYSA